MSYSGEAHPYHEAYLGLGRRDFDGTTASNEFGESVIERSRLSALALQELFNRVVAASVIDIARDELSTTPRASPQWFPCVLHMPLSHGPIRKRLECSRGTAQ